MDLTLEQRQVLKADVQAGNAKTKGTSEDGNKDVADLYNAPAVPVCLVWRRAVPIEEIGAAVDSEEFAAASDLELLRLSILAAFCPAGVDASRATLRSLYASATAKMPLTAANLARLWVRPATRFEQLFAVGVGSLEAPARLEVEGTIDRVDVLNARNA